MRTTIQTARTAASVALAGAAVATAAIGTMAAARAGGAPFSWTGVYVGGHAGAAIDYNRFSNPYGPTLFGDEVRSPGPFIGGQVGYNYQDGRAVYGLQADVSWSNMQGTATCMQPAHNTPGATADFAGGAFGATCQTEPDWFGTLTARGGLAFGPGGRMLVYGKGGLAWVSNDAEIAQNNIEAGNYGPGDASSTTKYIQWGWTLGAGLEYALTGRWSLGFEYDYLNFANRSVTTPDGLPMTNPGFPGIAGSTAMDGRLASVSQDVHAAKLVVNYALSDRGAPVDGAAGAAGAPALAATFAGGLDVEIGGRYVYGWSRFQQDLGKNNAPLPANASRLTWEGSGTSGAELYGRIDTPWNVMLKGFVGVGRGSTGNIFDEDWGLSDKPLTEITPYQVTRSSISSSLDYFTLDAGYDLLRTNTFRVAPFIGYNYFRYKMNALGCTFDSFSPPKVCNPADPPTKLFLQETDKWRSLRLGTSAELMLTPRLKLTGDLAYLPYVSYSGVDNHPLRPGEGASTRSPANGAGTGVQVECIISYDITEYFSVGAGGRFWSMGVPSGLTNFFSDNEFTRERFATEHTAVLAQGSYKFGVPD